MNKAKFLLLFLFMQVNHLNSQLAIGSIEEFFIEHNAYDRRIQIYYPFSNQIDKNTKFVIGGWHSNSRKINLFYVLYALKWQFEYNKKKNINYDWIAVVKKNNKWILKLTRYLGYETVKNDSLHYKAIKKNFKVKRKDFHFLKLKIKL